jgi:hypothetical protein
MALDPKFSTRSTFAGPFYALNRIFNRDSLQFHFSCYALCEIGFYEDDGERVVESVRLLGFWLTTEEANLAAHIRESLLRARHEKQYKVTNGRWPAWPWSDPGYTSNHYEIVPLSSVRFDDLMDLEIAIENAAKARVAGIGVDAARKGGAQ